MTDDFHAARVHGRDLVCDCCPGDCAVCTGGPVTRSCAHGLNGPCAWTVSGSRRAVDEAIQEHMRRSGHRPPLQPHHVRVRVDVRGRDGQVRTGWYQVAAPVSDASTSLGHLDDWWDEVVLPLAGDAPDGSQVTARVVTGRVPPMVGADRKWGTRHDAG